MPDWCCNIAVDRRVRRELLGSYFTGERGYDETLVRRCWRLNLNRDAQEADRRFARVQARGGKGKRRRPIAQG
jgi:hypothetical protein